MESREPKRRPASILWLSKSRRRRSGAREGARLIRLGIVDDHPVFRLGLRRTFEREGDMAVVWDAQGVDDLDRMIETAPVDVVLMDLNLGPDQDALAATTAIRERFDSTSVIVISASHDWEAASAARAAGASGYLPKDLGIADMVAAIRGLASPNFGRATFNDMLEYRSRMNRTPAGSRPRLTRREQEVLSELRHGRSNKEIAQRLGVSTTTINKHVGKVLKKLNARSRSQAVAMVSAESGGHPYLEPRRAG